MSVHVLALHDVATRVDVIVWRDSGRIDYRRRRDYAWPRAPQPILEEFLRNEDTGDMDDFVDGLNCHIWVTEPGPGYEPEDWP